MEKPTVHDIAREAGVSLATVDRVLNARPGVRATTVEKVQSAVMRIGYVRDTHAANLARQRVYRFVVVLPDGPNQFIESVAGHFSDIANIDRIDRTTLEIIRVAAHDPHALVRVLQTFDKTGVDGVALMAPETPQVRDEIAHLKEQGVAIVTLAADLPNSKRDHFVGINSFRAGRTAAELMGRFVKARHGTILVVANSMLSRDSIERRLGFNEVMQERFPHLTLLPSLESRHDSERMKHVVTTAFNQHPDIVGIYSMAGGNRALLEARRNSAAANRNLVFIAHELTDVTRQALIDREIDAVIMQNVGHLTRSALRVLRAIADQRTINEAQEKIRMEIVMRENLP